MNMMNLKKCKICPRQCLVNREKQLGFCNENEKLRIAKIIPNFKWEEPCITGEKGCFAIFFSGCNLRCDYCQNYEISRGQKGEEYTIEEFVKLIEENQDKNSYIDLITPTHFSKSLKIAFSKIQKKIPVIWNTNSYETIENIKEVSSFVDIFLADFKYFYDDLGEKFSHCKDYYETSLKSIKEMIAEKPDIIKKENMQQGTIIRHLVLPGHIENSLKILDSIKINFPYTKLSLMSQFTPNGHGTLNRKITPIEYKIIMKHLENLELTNGYFQEFESANDCFVPKFD